ncbi:hypothetical protein Patl1_24400 [Pistacia atlantica]|uniref:Uncharacterized protein n=1 Tax=Pistacia atlantica TaxID=434234 RepID=A0ACC0ZTS9_9ROSI|nr:hypothetical protein Patl1_24400 [Pistacia atlantica]
MIAKRLHKIDLFNKWDYDYSSRNDTNEWLSAFPSLVVLKSFFFLPILSPAGPISLSVHKSPPGPRLRPCNRVAINYSSARCFCVSLCTVACWKEVLQVIAKFYLTGLLMLNISMLCMMMAYSSISYLAHYRDENRVAFIISSLFSPLLYYLLVRSRNIQLNAYLECLRTHLSVYNNTEASSTAGDGVRIQCLY